MYDFIIDVDYKLHQLPNREMIHFQKHSEFIIVILILASIYILTFVHLYYLDNVRCIKFQKKIKRRRIKNELVLTNQKTAYIYFFYTIQ